MKFHPIRISIVLIVMLLLATCSGGGSGSGGGDSDSNNTAASSLEIILRGAGSDTLAMTAAQTAKYTVQSNNQQNCSVQPPDGGPVSGACLTPLQISGKVSGVSIGRQSGGPPARLLGGGSGLNNGGTIAAQAFDLADPTSLEGEDNVEGDQSGQSWDLVSANFYYLDLKFELNGKYWTVRHGFITEPIIEDDVIDACIPFETQDGAGDGEEESQEGDNLGGYRQDLIDNGFLIEGASFKKGDLLFCIKDNDSDCAVDEFKWFDEDTDTLVDTRPNSPRQVASIASHTTTCEPSSDSLGYSTNLGGFSMFAFVNDPFLLSAVFPNSPVKVYTFSSDGGNTTVEGTEMSLFVDFNVENSVFFPGIDEGDLDEKTDAEIAEVVFLTPLFIKDNAPEGTGYDPGVSVSVRAVLTGDPPPPVDSIEGQAAKK